MFSSWYMSFDERPCWLADQTSLDNVDITSYGTHLYELSVLQRC